MKLIGQHQLPLLYIHESIIDFNAQPLWREYFPDNAAGMDYAHIVCRNKKNDNVSQLPPDFLLYKLAANEEGLNRDFKFGKLLVQLHPKYDLWNLLFLCSTYLIINPAINVRSLMNKYTEPKGTKWIDKILHCTYGKLVYHFQLEQLYSLFTGFSLDLEKATRFRKAFNIKNHAVVDPVLTKQLTDGSTFGELIEQRRISDFVFKPQWEAAGKLVELLKGLKEYKGH